MSLGDGTDVITVLVQTIVTSISEVIQLVVNIEIENEKFMEVGCYLQRTSPAVLELQTVQNTPSNALEILDSLSKNLNVARDLINICSIRAGSISEPELESVVGDLENVIRNIGECLSLIPSSTFEGNEYAGVAVRSLSREMQTCCFKMCRIQLSEAENDKEDCPQRNHIAMEEESAVTEDGLHLPVESSRKTIEAASEENNGGIPRLVDFLRLRHARQGSHRNGSQSMKNSPFIEDYMEPLYESFFCPLTKKIMDDPVTVGSGVTYERRAISEWFTKCQDGSEDLLCPVTGQILESRALNTNLALKTTIEEWKERNEATRIKVARTALSLGSSESMIREALKDLQHLSKKRRNKVQMTNVGLLPLLALLLENDNTKVRCETLKTLRVLGEEYEEGKEMIAETKAIYTTIKLLSSDIRPERHLALSFLLEISRCETLCEKIGSVVGTILLLIRMKYSKDKDGLASEKADGILKNLEKVPLNMKIMAENGLLDPLLHNLAEGSEDMQMEMVSYLGEIDLGPEASAYVAKRASNALIKIVHSGNAVTRKAAFRALVHVSAHHSNSKILVEAGIIPVMTEEMFTRTIYNEPMDSKEESAAILANILESGVDYEKLTHGHTITSDYTIYGMAHMLRNAGTDEINLSLVKILLCLAKSPKAMATIVSATKDADVSYKLIELVDSLLDELAISSTKLLISLSAHMGHTIVDRLCKTKGQPENLITKLNNGRITEKHAVWANLLSKLPHQNLTLNLALLHKDIISIVLQKIHAMQRGEMRASRFTSSYLEGLVGILVRFTATVYDAQILVCARNHNLASVFTELLMGTGSDEVQRLAAIGLENLSSQSVHLSRPPEIRKTMFKFLPNCFTSVSSEKKKLHLCPVHRGACSSKTTFCLLESRALERLLACLDHENVQVVEAALSAVCTLLDDKVDVDKSVSLLSEVNAIQHVLNVLRAHRQEAVWQKSFWVIERFLMKGDRSISDISNDRLLPSTLVSAFHHGDSSTRRMAEKILRHLNKMPTFSTKVEL